MKGDIKPFQPMRAWAVINSRGKVFRDVDRDPVFFANKRAADDFRLQAERVIEVVITEVKK